MQRVMSTKPILIERSAEQIVVDEFMIARAKIVELAATLDRIERATGDVEDSKNMQLLVQGMHILCDDEVEKAMPACRRDTRSGAGLR